MLVQWGERLFYPRNRIVKASTPCLYGQSRAGAIRSRIEATVRRAPQVMVKVTGGGRGMAAIRAHFRHISKNGRLEIEDDRGVVERGKDAVKDIERQWEYGGAYIGEEGHRREAFNVMLSMPRGTDPLVVQKAAREFAKIAFADHRYVMVLHDHQANPHVHVSVKAESRHGQRLNPRKADPLARDLRRAAARVGRRRRGDPAGQPGRVPQPRRALAHQGHGAVAAEEVSAAGEEWPGALPQPSGGAGCLAPDLLCIGRFQERGRSGPGQTDRCLHQRHADDETEDRRRA